jgi:hypothetical protein
VADRSKVAEALASHPEAVAALKELGRDVDGSVRANAVWSLGVIGGRAEVPFVRRALRDTDVAVAGNAAAALARLGRRSGTDVVMPLCRALEDPRAYLRANALGGLAFVGQRCADGRERTLLLEDGAAQVRRAAARLLHRVPKVGEAHQDEFALDRCADIDSDGGVAASCATPPGPIGRDVDAITVYVVPAGQTDPTARAPFALVLPDGTMRLGITDRRGVVHEATAPRGIVVLAVPAPLAR